MKEMQIKNTKRYHFSSIKMVTKSQKASISLSMEKSELSVFSLCCYAPISK